VTPSLGRSKLISRPPNIINEILKPAIKDAVSQKDVGLIRKTIKIKTPGSISKEIRERILPRYNG